MDIDENLKTTFADLGLIEELCEACTKMGWETPSKIQQEAIPIILQGQDMMALAETGSGKTGAFALPILQALMAKPQRLFALILTPTRELAIQIKEQFHLLGKDIGLTCCVIIGGVDLNLQAIQLSKRPYILVATPGRLVSHIESTKNFKLNRIKFLVIDEADRMLNLGFEEEVDKILSEIPKERHTLLFSATMTTKVRKLQRAQMKTPVRVEVSSKFRTVDKLQQKMLFIPFDLKNVYLVQVLKQISSQSVIIFCASCHTTLKIALMLRCLGMSAIPIHSKATLPKRLRALEKFKNRERSILVGTDVISRGLDIPNVDYVINFDLPLKSKDYIHRVGRTARAGKSGTAITFITQYEIESFQRLEQVLENKLEVLPVNENSVNALKTVVAKAERDSRNEMKMIRDELKPTKRRNRRQDNNDDDDKEGNLGFRKKLKNKKY